jgi:hypothetical protein
MEDVPKYAPDSPDGGALLAFIRKMISERKIRLAVPLKTRATFWAWLSSMRRRAVLPDLESLRVRS